MSVVGVCVVWCGVVWMGFKVWWRVEEKDEGQRAWSRARRSVLCWGLL